MQIPHQHFFKKAPRSRAKECYRCGSSAHVARSYRFHDTICHNCHKRGKLPRFVAPGRHLQADRWLLVTKDRAAEPPSGSKLQKVMMTTSLILIHPFG